MEKIIEEMALNFVVKYFKDIGYEVYKPRRRSWDLDIVKEGKLVYKVEVKGRTKDNKGRVKLTTNELSMIENDPTFILLEVLLNKDGTLCWIKERKKEYIKNKKCAEVLVWFLDTDPLVTATYHKKY